MPSITYLDDITTAIVTLKNRKGSSRQAITKQVQASRGDGECARARSCGRSRSALCPSAALAPR